MKNMLRKFIKNRINLLLVLLFLFLFISGGFIYFTFFNRQVKGVGDKNQTKIIYKDGKKTTRTFGGTGKEETYEVSFLPNLKIIDNGTKQFIVEESVLSDTADQFSANIIFKHDDINLIFSVNGDSRTLIKDKTCFGEDEYEDLNSFWTKENMYDVSGQNIGTTYIQTKYYTEDKEKIDSMFDNYLEFQKERSLPFLEKSKIVRCSTRSRANPILVNTTSGERNGVVRVFVNKIGDRPSSNDLIWINDLIKGVSF
ncbi:MAG: hypothetical protein ACRCXZ_07785 [Patescibacteria group bacterium]